MPDYKGKVKYLKDGEEIDLGEKTGSSLYTGSYPWLYYIY